MLNQKFLLNKERNVITTENIEDFKKYIDIKKDSIIIGTHSGIFHSDEVLSTLLLKYHPNFEKINNNKNKK